MKAIDTCFGKYLLLLVGMGMGVLLLLLLLLILVDHGNQSIVDNGHDNENQPIAENQPTLNGKPIAADHGDPLQWTFHQRLYSLRM